MTRIRIKRVYEAPAPDDGCRVLVDRLWPRGVRRDALHCDVWARDLAPSAGLRSWYHADPGDRWEEFRRRYTDELRASQAVREFVRGIEGVDTVTLLYALEKCGGEPCAHPAGVFAESCRRGYNRVIFAIFASPCPGSGWKTMISAS